MLVHFDPPRICLHDGGLICLVPRIRSTGIFGPGGINLLVPRTALGGTESHVTPALKTCRLSLPRYCARGRNRQYRFSILQFFTSAVACEFVIICIITQFWCNLIYFIQNIALYCSAKLQNDQVMAAKGFYDINFLTLMIRLSHLLWLY